MRLIILFKDESLGRSYCYLIFIFIIFISIIYSLSSSSFPHPYHLLLWLHPPRPRSRPPMVQDQTLRDNRVHYQFGDSGEIMSVGVERAIESVAFHVRFEPVLGVEGLCLAMVIIRAVRSCMRGCWRDDKLNNSKTPCRSKCSQPVGF